MKRGAVWPLVIAGALAVHVVVSLVVVFIATSDASYAVEDDYYRKAMEWDTKRAQDHTNEVLGWSFDFKVSAAERPGGEARLDVVLADRTGVPLEGAMVSVEAFHNSRGDDILRTTLPATDDSGASSATLAMRRNGRWELRFTVEHDGKTFTHTAIRHLYVEGKR